MKKWICLICAITIFCSLCACGQKNPPIVKPVYFYYKTDPADYQQSSITPETRELEGYEDDLKRLIQLYVDGPITKAHINPFPERTTVNSIIVNNTTVEIQLNSPFAQLTDLDMTTACACLAMTVLEITQRHRLIITAVDDSGNIIYTGSMTRDHILLSDYD